MTHEWLFSGNTSIVRTHVYHWHGRVRIEMSRLDSGVAVKPITKFFVLAFDSDLHPIASTDRRNWEVISPATPSAPAFSMMPDTVAMLDRRTVAVGVPDMDPNLLYTIRYMVAGVDDLQPYRGEVEAKGI